MEQEFSPSGLGTKEHWDKVYERELENFEDNGEEGEIWFGNQCERRTLEWIKREIPKDKGIVDVGSGNGHFLMRLSQLGFERLHGIDYSEGAIILGERLAEKNKVPYEIKFIQGDLLSDKAEFPKVDLVVDKGTFDAISLGELERDGTKSFDDRIKQLCIKFKKTILEMLSSNEKVQDHEKGKFMITSCNWTEEELVKLFEPEFRKTDNVIHPSFTFGGHTGQTVTTVIFCLS